MPRSRPVALAVALVAGALSLAACTSSGGSTGSTGSTGTASPPAPTTTVTSTPVAPTSTAASPASSTTVAAPTVGPNVVHQTLTHFRIIDVTFVGAQAWALGSADCLSGGGVCDAIEYSGDGGRSWRSAPSPKANVQGTARPDCAAPCVTNIRFATSRIGYVYGANATDDPSRDSFFVTTNGGSTWKAAGAAEVAALETLDGNVIRVRTTSSGCPPGCVYAAETAPVGGTTFTRVTLPGRTAEGDAVTLTRTGSYAYLQLYGNPAGGAQSARSVLWTSAADGARWTNRAEVCPQSGSTEVDSVALTSAPDGSVSVLCRERGGQGRTFAATSTDHGVRFRVASRSALGSAGIDAFAAGSARTLLISSDQTYRSTDGGARFTRVGGPGQLAYLGFASATLVHGISLDHRSIWTSTNAGASWTSHRFS